MPEDGVKMINGAVAVLDLVMDFAETIYCFDEAILKSFREGISNVRATIADAGREYQNEKISLLDYSDIIRENFNKLFRKLGTVKECEAKN